MSKTNEKELSKILGRSERAVSDIWKMAFHIPGTMKFRESLLNRVLQIKKKLKVGTFKYKGVTQTLVYVPRGERKEIEKVLGKIRK